jgi:O-antigen/teichoic acid export membrane protein
VAGSRASLGALAGSLVGQAMLVISGPATARLVGVADRGRLALLVIIVTITSQISALGLPTAVAYFTSSSGVPATRVLRLLAKTWVILCLAAAIAAGAIAFLVSRTGGRSSGWPEALLSGIYVVSVMTFALMFACLQGERRFTPMNWLRITYTSFSAIVLFTLLALIHHASVLVVFSTLVLANVLACAIGMYLVVTHSSGPSASKSVTIRSLLRFGLAALPAANAPLETLSLDQAAVGAILPRQQLGLYVVAAAFDNLPSILMTAYGTVALTRITAETDVTARRHVIRRTAIGAIWIAGGAALFGEAIVGWLLPAAFGASFAAAVPVARILIVAGFLLSYRRILVVFLQAAGRPGRTAVGEAVGLGILAVGAIALVPTLGLVGAAYALILAAVVADAYLLWTLGWIHFRSESSRT